MFGMVDTHPIYAEGYYFSNFSLFIMSVAIILSTGAFGRILVVDIASNVRRFMLNVWLVVLFWLSLTFLAGATYNPFIYFRF